MLLKKKIGKTLSQKKRHRKEKALMCPSVRDDVLVMISCATLFFFVVRNSLSSRMLASLVVRDRLIRMQWSVRILFLYVG
jgi:hypothetical protein